MSAPDANLGAELYASEPDIRETARRFAALRLGLPEGAHVGEREVTDDDFAIAVVLWREWILGGSEGHSPLERAEPRELTDDEREWAKAWPRLYEGGGGWLMELVEEADARREAARGERVGIRQLVAIDADGSERIAAEVELFSNDDVRAHIALDAVWLSTLFADGLLGADGAVYRTRDGRAFFDALAQAFAAPDYAVRDVDERQLAGFTTDP